MQTHRTYFAVAILIAGVCLALAQPVRAQITTAVDSHGKMIFVNGDSPAPRRGSTISSAPAPAQGFRARNPEASPDVSGALPPPGFSATQPRPATSVIDQRLDRIVRDAAARHDLDPALVKAVISMESASCFAQRSGWPHATDSWNSAAFWSKQLVRSGAECGGWNDVFEVAAGP